MKKYELNAYGKVEKTREKRRDFPTFPQALLIYFLNVKWVGYGSMTQIITSPENPARFTIDSIKSFSHNILLYCFLTISTSVRTDFFITQNKKNQKNIRGFTGLFSNMKENILAESVEKQDIHLSYTNVCIKNDVNACVNPIIPSP